MGYTHSFLSDYGIHHHLGFNWHALEGAGTNHSIDKNNHLPNHQFLGSSQLFVFQGVRSL